LKNGAYGWWSPYDNSDWQFDTVQNWNGKTTAGIVVSGQFNPGTTAPTVASVNDNIRCRVCTEFEIVTKTTALESQRWPGSSGAVDAVNRQLAGSLHCMPNGKHLSFISDIIKQGGKFLHDNPELLEILLGGLKIGSSFL